MRLFNLLAQVHHACGLKIAHQKFMVYISKLIIYRHATFCLYKEKNFASNSVKLQGNFDHTKSNFCI